MYLHLYSSQLPVKYRIEYKFILLICKALNGLAPINICASLPHFHSQISHILAVPWLRVSDEDDFAVANPKLCNSLTIQDQMFLFSHQPFNCIIHFFLLLDFTSGFYCTALWSTVVVVNVLYEYTSLDCIVSAVTSFKEHKHCQLLSKRHGYATYANYWLPTC